MKYSVDRFGENICYFLGSAVSYKKNTVTLIEKDPVTRIENILFVFFWPYD